MVTKLELFSVQAANLAEYAFVSGHFTVADESHPVQEVNGNFTLLMMRSTNEIGGTWYVFKDHSA